MTRRAGSVRVLGSVAYTAQDPWIQNATLRANVLMGGDWDEDAYTATLQACALVTDLELLPAGEGWPGLWSGSSFCAEMQSS